MSDGNYLSSARYIVRDDDGTYYVGMRRHPSTGPYWLPSQRFARRLTHTEALDVCILIGRDVQLLRLKPRSATSPAPVDGIHPSWQGKTAADLLKALEASPRGPVRVVVGLRRFLADSDGHGAQAAARNMNICVDTTEQRAALPIDSNLLHLLTYLRNVGKTSVELVREFLAKPAAV